MNIGHPVNGVEGNTGNLDLLVMVERSELSLLRVSSG